MRQEQRLRVLQALGRYDAGLQALELGNSFDSVDDAQLKMMVQALLPPRLDSLRVLYVGQMHKLSDRSLETLVSAGCARNLTSLYLLGASLSPSVPSLVAQPRKERQHRSGSRRDGLQLSSSGAGRLRRALDVVGSSQ